MECGDTDICYLFSLTDVPPPPEVTVLYSDTETVSLGLTPTDSSDQYRLKIDYFCKTQRGRLIREDTNTVKFGGLNPGTEYTFWTRRISKKGNQSEAVSVSVFTGKYEII